MAETVTEMGCSAYEMQTSALLNELLAFLAVFPEPRNIYLQRLRIYVSS